MTDYGTIYHNSVPKTYEIRTRSKAEAEATYKQLAMDDFTTNDDNYEGW